MYLLNYCKQVYPHARNFRAGRHALIDMISCLLQICVIHELREENIRNMIINGFSWYSLIRRAEWTTTRTKKPKRTQAQFKIEILIAQGTTPLKSIICAAFLFCSLVVL